jgi:dTDP-glucose 4,6-dehydratase
MTTNRLARDLDELLNRSREAFEPLRGERIFITGGTGFVGTWLTEAFAWANRRLALGASAHLLSRDPQRFLQRAPHLGTDDAIVLLAGDATAFDPPPGTFRYVIHAATQMTSAAIAQRPVDTYEADVRATRNALEFARAAGAERLLYTSSGAAYGPQPPDFDALPESYPGAPSTTDAAAVYANAKRASEFLCATYAHQFGLTVPIARLFAFSGPYLPLDANFAIGNFVGDVLAGRPIAIAGDGTPYRSYLYAADLARWCWTIASAGASARVYNVGSSEARSIFELADLVRTTLSPATPITVAKTAVPGAVAPRYVPSVERVAAELRLEPSVSLTEGIRRMAEWYRTG